MAAPEKTFPIKLTDAEVEAILALDRTMSSLSRPYGKALHSVCEQIRGHIKAGTFTVET